MRSKNTLAALRIELLAGLNPGELHIKNAGHAAAEVT